MLATELIKQLQELVMKHGDCHVVHEYGEFYDRDMIHYVKLDKIHNDKTNEYDLLENGFVPDQLIFEIR